MTSAGSWGLTPVRLDGADSTAGAPGGGLGVVAIAGPATAAVSAVTAMAQPTTPHFTFRLLIVSRLMGLPRVGRPKGPLPTGRLVPWIVRRFELGSCPHWGPVPTLAARLTT